MAMLEIRNVQKTFRTYAKPGLFHRPGERKVASELPVLRGVDLTVEKGDVPMPAAPTLPGCAKRPPLCSRTTTCSATRLPCRM